MCTQSLPSFTHFILRQHRALVYGTKDIVLNSIVLALTMIAGATPLVVQSLIKKEKMKVNGLLFNWSNYYVFRFVINNSISFAPSPLSPASPTRTSPWRQYHSTIIAMHRQLPMNWLCYHMCLLSSVATLFLSDQNPTCVCGHAMLRSCIKICWPSLLSLAVEYPWCNGLAIPTSQPIQRCGCRFNSANMQQHKNYQY